MNAAETQLTHDVLSRIANDSMGVVGIIDAVSLAATPALADGIACFVPSLVADELSLAPGKSGSAAADAIEALAGVEEYVRTRLAAGTAGLLDPDQIRDLALGGTGDATSSRDLCWASVALAPMIMPGHASGAILYWRGSGRPPFAQDDVHSLLGMTSLCASLILVPALIDHPLLGRDLAESLPEAVIAVDAEFRVVRWNTAAAELYGIPAHDAIRRPLGTLYSTYYDDPDMDSDRAWEELRRTGLWQGLVTQQSKSGRTLSVSAMVTTIRDDTDRLIGAVAVNRDNSDIVRAGIRLQVAEQLLADVLDAAGAMAVVLDEHGIIVAANREWLDQALVNHARMDLVSVGADYLRSVRKAAASGDRDAARALASLEQVITGAAEAALLGYRCDRPDGPHWYHMEIRRLTASRCAAVTHREVTTQHRLEEMLEYRETHDALTGLGNRLFLAERVSLMLDEGPTRPGQLGLLVCDIDDFAAVNEALGHTLGDEVLRMVADRIRLACPPTFVTARLGGDQFAVLAQSGVGDDLLAKVADHVRDAVAQPIGVSGHHLSMSLSIGLGVVSPSESHSGGYVIEELFARADNALTDSKSQGRNRVRSYRPEHRDRTTSLLQLRHEFATALHSGELELYYQQIRRLTDDMVVGFEALARWPRAGGPVLTPATFGPVLSSAIIAGPLAQWSIAVAVRDALALREHFPFEGLRVGVNISAQQFMDVNVAAQLVKVGAHLGLPLSAIVVEMTETTAFTDSRRVRDQLVRLHEQGVRISLDDFGTGFSSLKHLRELPVDSVKVDKSFTERIASDPTVQAVVRALIGLAHDLGLTVIAEGVESKAQLDWLAANNCDQYQGYYGHRPAPLAQLLGT